MSIICSICHDSLSERPQSLPQGNELIVVALRCGHLFHEYCIQQWFNTGGANPASYVECPCCKKSSSLKNALRVYPTCEEESQERTRSRVSNQEPSKDVVQELEDAREILQQISSSLESETSAHESLQLEHGKLQSELHELKEQMNENKQIWKGIEASLKSKMEKLEKDKEEVKKIVFELQTRDRRLHRQLELLKTMQEESKAALAAQKDVEKDCVDQVLLSLSNTSAYKDFSLWDNDVSPSPPEDDDEFEVPNLRPCDFWLSD